MRRTRNIASALAVFALLAGCSAPAAEPSAIPTASEVSEPPTPAPENVGWVMPTSCEDAVWPALQRVLDEGVEQLEERDFTEQTADFLPSGVNGLACTNYIPNSDGVSSWSIAQLPTDRRDEALDIARSGGFQVEVDIELSEGVRFLTLVRPDIVDESGYPEEYGESITIIGDAWLHMGGATVYAIELLREMAAHVGLPIDVAWLVPLNCASQALAWPALNEGGRLGEWSGHAAERSGVTRLAGVVGQDDVLLECGWALDAAPSSQFAAELYSTAGRLTPASRTAVLDWLLANGWEITSDLDGRTDLIRADGGFAAGILTDDGIVLAEPLESADASIVEPFAERIGMLG